MKFNADEVIETSDPEELEEILAARRKLQLRTSQADGRQSPRKRLKLYHDYSDLFPRTPGRFLSPSPTPTSPRSLSPLEYTSPASLTRASSSKPSSPVATPPISAPDSSISPLVVMEDLFESNSQDPLLLNLTSPKHNHPPDETPHESPTSSARLDLNTIESFGTPRSASPGTPSMPRRSRSESVDPLLLFTPSRPLIQEGPIESSATLQIEGGDDPQFFSPKAIPPNILLSPLTPAPSEKGDNGRQESPPAIRRPFSSPNHANGSETVSDLAANMRRYALRERQAKQLRPYKHDKAQYQISLRNNPDAMITVRSPKRGDRQQRVVEEDYEGSQRQSPQEIDGYEAENDFEWEEPRRHRKTRSRSKSRSENPLVETPHNPWSLPEVSDTDEEVESSTKALNKEGRRILREKKKREAADKPRGRKNARPFPLKKSVGSQDYSLAEKTPSHSPSHSTRARTLNSPPPIAPQTSSPDLPSRPLTPVIRSSTRSTSPAKLFHDNSDVEMHATDFSPPRLEANDGETPILVSDDDRDNASPSPTSVRQSQPDPELSKEEKKQRRRIRALNRMFPAFMRDRMMKQANDTAHIPAKRQHSVAVSSDSDEYLEPLLPGQTRTRRAEHPRDPRDIKGDSESSDGQVVSSRNHSSDGGPAASDSDVEVVWSHRKRHVQEKFHLWQSDEEDVLSDDKIDDEIIEAYLKEAPLRRSGLRERDMIDWMLDNTAEVGGTRRPRARVKSTGYDQAEGSRRPKIKVVTRGARKYGRERQTLLTFDKPAKRTQIRERQRDPSPLSDAGQAPSLVREGRKRAVRQEFSEPSTHRRSRVRRRHDLSADSNTGRASPVDNAATFPAYATSASPLSPAADLNVHMHNMPDADALRKAARKQKEKERRARMKMNGVHVFVPERIQRITGLRSKAFTIDLADHGFHRALAPVRPTHRPQSRPQPLARLTVDMQGAHTDVEPKRHSEVTINRRLLPRGDRPYIPANLSDEEIHKIREETPDSSDAEEHSLLIDFGIPLIPSGTAFGPSTYIGKGRLSRLVELVSPDPNPSDGPGVPYYSAHGFDLGPGVTVPRLLAVLGQICDRFFEFATGLPEEDNEQQAKDWDGLTGVTCQLVTSLLAAGDQTQELKDAVQTQILRLVSRMREASLTAKSMDSSTFSICWFAVEMSARLGFRLPAWNANRSPEINVLSEASALLIEYLLEYGWDRAMEPLVNVEDGLDGSTPNTRALEAWLCMVHLVENYVVPDVSSPLWKMVRNVLEARDLAQTSDFEASETIWRTIIGLSVISRFSIHGMATSKACSPPCWGLVVFALERIRFEANDQIDESVSESGLETLDRYIKLVVERCCLLWSRWQWTLDEAFPALLRLFEIFRSRKFANLRQEKAEYPDFLRVNDWTLLSRPIHSESAFVLFLKLVYQTLLVNKTKVKKLLSLAMPVGSLPFSKLNPPRIHDLSMLFNRLSALAIGLHVEPNQHARWIQLARQYVKFNEADATTRNAYIRGFMYLSIVMVQLNIQLDSAIDWLSDMVTVLLDEHKQQGESRTVVCIHALVGSVRNILRAYKGTDPRRYPDPRLLLSLERIFRDASLVKPNNASAHVVPRVIQSFLTARALAVPPPKRPPIIASDSQESQDEYGALAFDDDLIAALDEEDSGYKKNDQSLCKLFGENISWMLYRQLVEYTSYKGLKENFKNNDRLSSDIASLAGCWLGCGNIIIQSNAEMSWPKYLSAFGRHTGNLDGFCQRKINLLVYSNVLKLNPMSYLTLKENFMDVLFESLAAWHTTTEDDFVQLLLSVDGAQYPLLKCASWDPDEHKHGSPNVELLAARLPLLIVIFANLDQCLSDTANPEMNISCVGYCIKMFAAMKNIHSELSAAAQRSYASWCLQVYQKIQDHPSIMGDGRLSQWTAWARRLSDM
ncbi:Mus7/MMS22 family-domain-containing protein [Mycena sp. CBHHK59/15]|nr:Mus7/MMS22 family-domain-containing protein [Mycena sp. CBHHK59/15]